MSSNVIELKNVWKKYSKGLTFHNNLREDLMNLFKKKQNDLSLNKEEFWVLKSFNLSVQKGETLGLYGPNGTGKSTILKLISNVTYPDSGEIIVKGRVAPLLEVGAGFHPDLTGKENIFMNGTILGMKISEVKSKLKDIINFSGIEKFIDMPVKKYSSGMYLRLAFSIAIHSGADIFLFDEILAVGDENFKKQCYEKIDELKKERKTMIIVSHNRDVLEKYSDKIKFFNNLE